MKIHTGTASVVLAIMMLFQNNAFALEKDDNPNYSSNFINDFNTDDNIVQAGRWSYLKGTNLIENNSIRSMNYLQKGDGTAFNPDEWADNASYGNYTRFFKSDGTWMSDTIPLAAVYTVDKNYANAPLGINIKGSVDACHLIIAKTSDARSDILKGSIDILYEQQDGAHEFDFTVPKNKWNSGDDIIFFIERNTGNEWWVPRFFDVTVKAMNVEQTAIPVMTPELPDIPYGSKVSLASATADTEIYYTLDGSDPAVSDTRILYTEPFTLTDHTDVTACAEKEGMERSYIAKRHYIMDYPIREFLGTNQGTTEEIEGIKWSRLDIGWAWTESERGVYDPENIKDIGDQIMDLRSQGYEPLPVIAYSPMWAVEQNGYSFTHRLTGETYTYGPASEETGWEGTFTIQNKFGEITTSDEYVLTDKYQMRSDAVDDWKRFVGFIVDTFSQAPYNLEYFGIWNEAYPSSGFYMGDIDQYFRDVHNPAAEVVHSKGKKVVFGGWPCCGPMSELIDLLDRNDSWKTIDIYDIHYHPLASMDYLWRAAKERGIETPCIWQTEMGFSSQPYYSSNIFARTLRWALDKGMYEKSDDVSKLMWFAAYSPDDPKAYGYNACMYAGSRLTANGEQIKNFAEMFYSNSIKKYDNFVTSPLLKPEIDEMSSSAEGFLLDDNKAIISMHLVKQNNYSNLMCDVNGNGKTIDLDDGNTYISVDLDGISGDNIKIVRKDCIGNETVLEYTRLENGKIRVYVPTKEEDEKAAEYSAVGSPVRTIYLVVSADNIKDGMLTAPNYPAWTEKGE